MSRRSRKPRVVMKAMSAPFRSRRALVATVEPWMSSTRGRELDTDPEPDTASPAGEAVAPNAAVPDTASPAGEAVAPGREAVAPGREAVAIPARAWETPCSKSGGVLGTLTIWRDRPSK